MAVSTGSARSNVTRSQPAKIEMLPVAARWQPPETGQSTAAPPAPVTRAARRRTSASSVVLISAQMTGSASSPRFDRTARPARMPSEASITAALTEGLGRQVITTSAVAAISAGLSAQPAPADSSAAAAERSRSRTTRSKPLRSRLPASFDPTFPNPMNPTLTEHHLPIR